MQSSVKSNLWTPDKSNLPYSQRPKLLTEAEFRFYSWLRHVRLGVRYTISIKPRLADVIECPPELWLRDGRRISQKHVDFLLYHTTTTESLIAIELDDRSHLRAERQKRDAFVDEALRTAGVPLLRYQ